MSITMGKRQNNDRDWIFQSSVVSKLLLTTELITFLSHTVRNKALITYYLFI